MPSRFALARRLYEAVTDCQPGSGGPFKRRIGDRLPVGVSPAAEGSTAQAQAWKPSEAKVEPEKDLPNSEVPELTHDKTTEVEVLTNKSTAAAEVPSEVPDDEPIGICEYEVMKATYEPCSGDPTIPLKTKVPRNLGGVLQCQPHCAL